MVRFFRSSIYGTSSLDQPPAIDLLRGYGERTTWKAMSRPSCIKVGRHLDTVIARIYEIQSVARSAPDTVERPRWPMIVFRTPKGWTGPKFVDGKPVPVEIVSPITPGRCFTNQSWA